MPRKIARYGWKPDFPDHRDVHYHVSLETLNTLPPSVNLTAQNPPVYDQGDLGSCTSNAIAGALEFDQMKQKLTHYVPSRLFVYYNTRALEGTTAYDSGASLRDTCKAVSISGYPNEVLWPYVISEYTVRPPYDDYQVALPNKNIVYSRVGQSLQLMKGVLAQGYVFIFGIAVYESFESQMATSTGIIPLPASTEHMIGGHALVAVGYTDASQRFLFRNSWGSSWGAQGYGTIPYAYLMSGYLAGDMWTVSHVTG